MEMCNVDCIIERTACSPDLYEWRIVKETERTVVASGVGASVPECVRAIMQTLENLDCIVEQTACSPDLYEWEVVKETELAIIASGFGASAHECVRAIMQTIEKREMEAQKQPGEIQAMIQHL